MRPRSRQPECFAIATLLLGCAGSVMGQETVALTGARVHDGVGNTIENATILIRDGRIAAVGANLEAPAGARVFDLSGKVVIPGMMDNHSHIGALPTDLNDRPVTIGPEHRILDALRLDDPDWKEAVSGGVTTVVTGPGSGENVSGQSVVIKTFGDSLEKRLLNDRGGMKFAMGAKSRVHYPSTTMGVAASLRSYLIKTREYMASWAKWEEGDHEDLAPARNLGFEAMAEVLSGENRVRAHVHSAHDVMTLLRLKDEFGFDLTLHHSTDAYKVADEIAKRKVNAVVLPLGPRIGLSEDVMYGPYHLWKAGVKIALHTDHPVINQKWLRINAGMAIRYGLPEDEALKAVTINPAQIARVDDRVGSIEVGKDADLVVLNGPWYEPKSRIELVFGEGETIYDRTEKEKEEGQ